MRTPVRNRPARRFVWLYLGPGLLFATCAAYGVLEVHPANDTWIGLAAGRQILSADKFPRTDSFSYTAAGRTWYNQNWLAHACYYWLYDRISPDAIVYATWTLGAAVFLLVLLAAYWRTRCAPGALLAAAGVAFGCRDYLGIRPATVGLFLLAALWALLCALEAQGARRRRWPLLLLPPLLLVWGNAHGSFVFAYGVIGLYVLHRVVSSLFGKQRSIGDSQLAALLALVVLAGALTILLSPFGIQNFLHGKKVAVSSVWRDVAEWQSPLKTLRAYPPVWRFWSVLAACFAVLLIAALTRLLGRAQNSRGTERAGRPRLTMFDGLMVVIALGMTFWARRFAPIFLIFAGPLVLTAALRISRPLADSWRRRGRLMLTTLAGVAAVGVGAATGRQAYADLVKPYAQHPEFGLLERITVYDIVPQDGLRFIANNGLELNLLTEWALAGAVMLHAPTAKVFVDGRAQQVYDESHYRQYKALFVASDTPWRAIAGILDRSRSNAVFLRQWERGRRLWQFLESAPNWVLVAAGSNWRIYLRKDCEPLRQLGRRLRSDSAWWPATTGSLAGRAFVWSNTSPEDPERAVQLWMRAVRARPTLGTLCSRPLTRALLELKRESEARQFIDAFERALARPRVGIAPDVKERLIKVLQQCRQDVAAFPAGSPGKE